uniref:Hormogonium polysaccharide biosynthesis protein HpsA n=1 Tax=Desertifilum tharense IPPAS B-1220 TaxID=1781255 RepID=A0ACD5H261_9CYAN
MPVAKISEAAPDRAIIGGTATVLADAITLLSSDYRYGFRNEGDYDLRNNQGQSFVRYDLNGDGDFDDSVTFNETTFPGTPDAPVDLNGNGNTTDTSVALLETEVPAKVARRLNGFFDNNFVTSRNFLDSDYRNVARFTGADLEKNSSYFNNLVTPVQRRVSFPEYLMEVCPKLPVSQCGSNDWFVDPNPAAPKKAKDVVGQAFDIAQHKSGTTKEPADPAYRRFARRVAFLRNDNAELVDSTNATLAANARPFVLGISTSGNIQSFATDGSITNASSQIRTTDNTLWFRTIGTGPRNIGSNFVINASRVVADVSGTPRLKDQPIVAPVLQLQLTTRLSTGDQNINAATGSNSLLNFMNSNENIAANQTNWMPHPPSTGNTYNLILAAGDTPGRPFDNNGGVANYVRFLESWNPTATATSAIPTRISGSLIQMKRSSYATAPFRVMIPTADLASGTYNQARGIFNYPQRYRKLDDSTNVLPYYDPPTRNWGFDVALLSQGPDLFSTQFTLPPTAAPSDFFRQVGRDDEWVRVLLCAAQPEASLATPGNPSTPIPGGYVQPGTDDPTLLTQYVDPPGGGLPQRNYKFAISRDQRPRCSTEPNAALRQPS